MVSRVISPRALHLTIRLYNHPLNRHRCPLILLVSRQLHLVLSRLISRQVILLHYRHLNHPHYLQLDLYANLHVTLPINRQLNQPYLHRASH